jgi:hypothetical protein
LIQINIWREGIFQHPGIAFQVAGRFPATRRAHSCPRMSASSWFDAVGAQLMD